MIIFPRNQSIKQCELKVCECGIYTFEYVLMCRCHNSCNSHFFVKHEVMFINTVLITLLTKLFGAMLFA